MEKRKTLNTHQRGKKAEDRAAAYLRLKGYRIIERNYRVPPGEIDLIVQRGGTLVFVEVKARRGTLQGSPLEAVPPQKVRRISAAAALYLAGRKTRPPCRFDVMTVGPDKNWLGSPKIRHLENAFSVAEDYNV